MRRFLLLILSLTSIVVRVAAEDNIHIGAYFSYGGASTAEKVPTFQDCNCPAYSDIRGDLIAGGIVVQLPFSVGDGLNVGLLGQFGYGTISLSQVQPGDRLPSLDQDGNVVYSTTEHRLIIDQQGALIDVAADLTYSGLTLDVGLTALFNAKVSGRKTLELVEPPDAAFDPFLPGPGEGVLEDEDTYLIQEWNESGVKSVSYGIYGALGYTLDFGIITTTLAAESRLLWVVAIPDATAPLWTYGGVLRVMLDL